MRRRTSFLALLVLAILASAVGCRKQAPSSSAARPAQTLVVPSTAPVGTALTPSGLRFQVLQQGTGVDHPDLSSTVRVHYTGWRADGSVLDSSVERGTPAIFKLSALIPGLSEGLLHMVEGQKMRLWIPAHLAYRDRPNIGGPLVFDVELLEIIEIERAEP